VSIHPGLVATEGFTSGAGDLEEDMADAAGDFIP
jgi:hypothetical protein